MSARGGNLYSRVMEVDIAQAREDDLEAMLGVIDDAATWLHSIGVTEQWPASFSARPEWVEEFRDLIRRGCVFLVWRDGSAVGGVVLEEQPYGYAVEKMWPDGAVDAVLLFRLAVRRAVAGTGVARRLLDWALDYTRQRGKNELRLDCWAGNERLKRYYSDAGFEPCGDIEIEEPDERGGRTFSVSRFRKAVS